MSGDEIVEQSLDGGATWSISWEIPAGRREVMDRLARIPMACGSVPKTIWLGPFDVIILGNGDSPSAVVAMGNEGVLHPQRLCLEIY